MTGLHVRDEIDSTDSYWNTPMRLTTGEFAYCGQKRSARRGEPEQ